MLDYSAVLQHDIPFWRVKEKKGKKEGIVCSLYFAKLVFFTFAKFIAGLGTLWHSLLPPCTPSYIYIMINEIVIE